MQFDKQVLAYWRAPIRAALAGSGVGLGLGALFLAAGMGGHAVDRAHAQRMAEAAAVGYAGSPVEAEGQGLRTGLQRYAFQPGPDAAQAAARFDADRGAAKARRRSDLECLTQAVYFEARGESVRGQTAVAQVVLNRVKHPAYPKSVCAVVFQGAGRSGCQFSFACDGSMRKRRESLAWKRARDIATRTLTGAARADIGSATHFHTTTVSPAWAPQMLRVANVGTHIFYKFSPYRLRRAPAPEPQAEQAVLIAGPAGQVPELRLMPALLEQTVEASLEPVPTPAAAPQPKPAPAAAPAPTAPKAADSAQLAAPQPVAAAS